MNKLDSILLIISLLSISYLLTIIAFAEEDISVISIGDFNQPKDFNTDVTNADVNNTDNNISTTYIRKLDPVTYTCCKNYIDNILENFEKSHIWMLDGENNSQITDDKINFKEGIQGLKFVAKSGDKAYATLRIDKDLSNTENFVFDIYVYDESTLGYITFYFTSAKGWTKFYSHTIEPPFVKGWNRFIIKKSDLHNTGEEDWNNPMIFLRFSVFPIPGKDTNVTIDNFRYNIRERPKAILAFDNEISISENASQILLSNNQKGIYFVKTKDVNNIEKLKKLQDEGWDISGQISSQADLTELDNNYNWLVSNRFQNTAGFLDYPYGYWTEGALKRAKEKYILAIGLTKGSEAQLSTDYGDNLYKLKTIEISDNSSIQSIKDAINSTIEQKGLIILLFHQIDAVQQISDYLKNRESDIDVITFSEYVNPNINIYTPIINKTVKIFPNGNVDILDKNRYDEYMPDVSIRPSVSSIDIKVNKYSRNEIIFNESSNEANLNADYSIGDRIPSQKYNVKTYWEGGKLFQNFYVVADDTGHINYSSTGFNYSRYTEISPLTVDDGNIHEYKVFKNMTHLHTQSSHHLPGFESIELMIGMLIVSILILKKKRRQ